MSPSQHLLKRLCHENKIAYRQFSYPECDEGRQCDGGEKVPGELVVAGGDSSEVLQSTKRILDEMAAYVTLGVVEDLALSI